MDGRIASRCDPPPASELLRMEKIDFTICYRDDGTFGFVQEWLPTYWIPMGNDGWKYEDMTRQEWVFEPKPAVAPFLKQAFSRAVERARG